MKINAIIVGKNISCLCGITLVLFMHPDGTITIILGSPEKHSGEYVKGFNVPKPCYEASELKIIEFFKN